MVKSELPQIQRTTAEYIYIYIYQYFIYIYIATKFVPVVNFRSYPYTHMTTQHKGRNIAHILEIKVTTSL